MEINPLFDDCPPALITASMETITPKRAAQIHAKLLVKAHAKAKENMTTNPIPNFEHDSRRVELLAAVANAIEPFLSRSQAHRGEEVAEAVLKVIRGNRS